MQGRGRQPQRKWFQFVFTQLRHDPGRPAHHLVSQRTVEREVQQQPQHAPQEALYQTQQRLRSDWCRWTLQCESEVGGIPRNPDRGPVPKAVNERKRSWTDEFRTFGLRTGYWTASVRLACLVLVARSVKRVSWSPKRIQYWHFRKSVSTRCGRSSWRRHRKMFEK